MADASGPPFEAAGPGAASEAASSGAESGASDGTGTGTALRWEEIQWAGRDLSHIGLDLKKMIIRLPSKLGTYARHVTRLCRPITTHGAGGVRQRDLLPFPVDHLTTEEEEWAWRVEGKAFKGSAGKSDAVLRGAAGVKAWLWLMCVGLNFMHSAEGSVASRAVALGPPSLVQVEALRALERDALYFCTHGDTVVPATDWWDYLGSRAISYSGEEVGVARPLSWEQMVPALPPKDACGVVDAAAVATGGIREILLNPELCMKERDAWPEVLTKVKRHTKPGELQPIVQGLVQQGLCALTRQEAVCHVHGKPLGNGFFGVGKGAYLPGGEDDPEREILRFIMNLIPFNELQELVPGDIETLPYMGQWSSLQIMTNNVLAWSSEDLKCMFYVFRLPEVWWQFLAFEGGYPGEWFGRPGTGNWVLTSRVLGMGWKNSVGIAQHLNRNLLLGKGPRGAELPVAQELRKDRPLPAKTEGGLEATEDAAEREHFWQAYLDNFDEGRELTEDEARVVCGAPSEWQRAARAAYAHWSVPVSEQKAVNMALETETLGGNIDGRAGRIQGAPKKNCALFGLTCFLLKQRNPPLKLVQMVSGRWNHKMQFRRPTQCCFRRLWRGIAHWHRRRDGLKPEMEEDFVKAMMLAPLMRMDLRSRVSGLVTASDASEEGGGVCSSSLLTSKGMLAVNQSRGRRPEGRCPGRVLLINLLGGIGGARQACDNLQLGILGHVSASTDKGARKVIKETWPETLEWGASADISEAEVRRLPGRFSATELVLIVGTRPEGRAGRTEAEDLKLRLLKNWPGVEVKLLLEATALWGSSDTARGTSTAGLQLIRCFTGLPEGWGDSRAYYCDWELVGGPGARIERRGEESAVTFLDPRLGAKCSDMADATSAEKALGYRPGHTSKAFPKRERHLHKDAVGAKRLAYLAEALDVTTIAWLVSQLLLGRGWLDTPPSLDQCHQGWPREEAEGGSASLPTSQEMVGNMMRYAQHRGSDIRITTGELLRPDAWPRRAIPSTLWQWKAVLAFPWKDGQGSEHINALELRAYLATLKWRTRRRGNLNTRFFHLIDSQVSLGVLTKGRTAAFRLAAIVEQCNAIQLAGGLHPFLGYVATDDNPADEPSRRFGRKGKKK